MKLNSNELSQHLKGGLHGIYFLHGAEDLLLIESLDKLRANAFKNEYKEKSRFTVSGRFNWDQVLGDLKTQSLFSEKKILEIHMPNSRPGKKGSEALIKLVEEITEDQLLIIICGKLEKGILRSKWVNFLNKKSVSVECKKVYPWELPKWIKSRLRDQGLSINREALDMFVALTEGNLFVAMQSIDRLLLMETEKSVTMEDINQCVADGAHFDLFQLTDAAMMKQPSRVLRIFESLKKEGMQPFELMRVVNWEIKNLYDLMIDISDGISVNKAIQQAKAWPRKQKMYGSFLRSINKQHMEDILDQACSVDKIIKGVNKGNPWDEISRLLFMFASKSRTSQ